MKHFGKLLSAIFMALPMAVWADAPAGYYSSCEGKSGKNLLQALFNTVSSHTNVGYDGLWSVYATSDVYPSDGKIWDMYSTKHWPLNSQQCGSYSVVGDCYNREHSMPKSWFSNHSPMVSDAYHIYPTDGKVNGQRSNYPYGECANGNTLPSSGGVRALGRLGSSTFPGYSGTVFEPDDEYKGDFARSYFYMAAAYYDRIGGWSSPMLAGNAYPAFSSWAVNLLLKWHRQDPVSSKEETRNDAVYAWQHNRNPFIDHPEMVEYIWGDKQDQSWSGNPAPTAAITLPADGATIDIGTASRGRAKTATFTVKGTGITGEVSVTATGGGYTVSPATLDAATVNSTDGARVTVRLLANSTGKATGKATISVGSLKSTVNLTADVVEGIYAYPARNISDQSFTASWIYAGDELPNGAYTLHVKDVASGEEQTMHVGADEGEYDVDGLSQLTTYDYWLTGATSTSNTQRFTTGGVIPSITLLYEGVLRPEAVVGERSISYEVIVDADNIDNDITIGVDAPFAVSTDKSSWSRTITISPDEQRFYLSIKGDTPGVYSTDITLTAGDYVNTDITIEGEILGDSPFTEDFEADLSGCSTYDGCTYRGTASLWYLLDAGLWESDSKYAHTGRQAVRMGKSALSTVQMQADKPGGIGRVSLWAARWSSSDGDATFHLEYSTDGGESWHEASAPATVSTDDYACFEFDVNVAGSARLRVVQTEGHRFMLDDLTISNFTNAGLDGVESDYHSWDAYNSAGRLVIESRCAQSTAVYGMDGATYFSGDIPAGRTEVDVPSGLYVVRVADFSRTVMVNQR